jgi:hypothetical protein
MHIRRRPDSRYTRYSLRLKLQWFQGTTRPTNHPRLKGTGAPTGYPAFGRDTISFARCSATHPRGSSLRQESSARAAAGGYFLLDSTPLMRERIRRESHRSQPLDRGAA